MPLFWPLSLSSQRVQLSEAASSNNCCLCRKGWESESGSQQSCVPALALIHLFHLLTVALHRERLSETLAASRTAVREPLREVCQQEPSWFVWGEPSHAVFCSPTLTGRGPYLHTLCARWCPPETLLAGADASSEGLGPGFTILCLLPDYTVRLPLSCM